MEKPDEKSIELSLMDTIKSSEAVDILKDSGEIFLDSFLQDGLLKDVPVINSVLSLGKTATRISDLLFMKKVVRFIQNLDNISEFEKYEEWRKIQEDRQYARKVGETIILLLDRFDSLDKPILFARVHSAFIKGEIDKKEYKKISSGIDRANIEELKSLLSDYSDRWKNDAGYTHAELFEKLYLAGFSDITFDSVEYNKRLERKLRSGIRNPAETYVDTKGVMKFRINNLAETFIRTILTRESLVNEKGEFLLSFKRK